MSGIREGKIQDDSQVLGLGHQWMMVAFHGKQEQERKRRLAGCTYGVSRSCAVTSYCT